MFKQLPTRRRQRGITFVGGLILVAFIGMFVYAGIRLTPLYVEYLNVSKVFDSLKSETEGSVSAQSIRSSLERRFGIDDIHSLDWHDVEITREGTAWTVHAAYDAQTPFISNVGFVVHFEKTVTLSTTGGA
jgi:Domain of unknown function (DUF4845)